MVEVGGSLVHLPAVSLQQQSLVPLMIFAAAGKSIRIICEKAAEVGVKKATKIQLH
jgi:hypothetical protein